MDINTLPPMASYWDNSIPNLSRRLVPVKFVDPIWGGFSNVFQGSLDNGQVVIVSAICYRLNIATDRSRGEGTSNQEGAF
jgi:hypothetical protein